MGAYGLLLLGNMQPTFQQLGRRFPSCRRSVSMPDILQRLMHRARRWRCVSTMLRFESSTNESISAGWTSRTMGGVTLELCLDLHEVNALEFYHATRVAFRCCESLPADCPHTAFVCYGRTRLLIASEWDQSISTLVARQLAGVGGHEEVQLPQTAQA